MALRKEEEIRAELAEIDTRLEELDTETSRLLRMKKGIIEAYGLEDMKPKKSWSRRSKKHPYTGPELNELIGDSNG